MNVETANRLQKLRKQNGYSQEELAEKIGISRQAVSKWERAEASPDTDNLILLARLYGVTLDELLNTESVPMPNSEGISLSKEYYTTPPDDGEIYPEGHPKYKAPENDNAYGKTEEKVESDNPAPTVGKVVKTVAEVIGDAIETPATSVREGKANAPQDGSDNGKSYADAFEKNFKDFGERMKSVGTEIQTDMKELGKSFESDMKEFSKDFKSDMKEVGEDFRNDMDVLKKEKKEKKRYPATLLDKLYPIIVVGFFLFTVFYKPYYIYLTWMVFFTIPIYYIISYNGKKIRYGDSTAIEALKGMLDGSMAIILTFFYFVFGFLFDQWDKAVPIFLLIPIYYVLSYNFSQWYKNKKSFGMAVKGFFDGTVPIIATFLYLLTGLLFGEWVGTLFLLLLIPVYYIISSHYSKKG